MWFPSGVSLLSGVNPRIPIDNRRDGRVVEGARLESVFRGNSNVGSNPTLSAIIDSLEPGTIWIFSISGGQWRAMSLQ